MFENTLYSKLVSLTKPLYGIEFSVVNSELYKVHNTPGHIRVRLRKVFYSMSPSVTSYLIENWIIVEIALIRTWYLMIV